MSMDSFFHLMKVASVSCGDGTVQFHLTAVRMLQGGRTLTEQPERSV